MKKLFISTLALIAAIPAFGANSLNDKGIKSEILKYEKRDKTVYFEARIDLGELDLKKYESVVITPIIRSTENPKLNHEFAPVVVYRKTSKKLATRAAFFDNNPLTKETPQSVVFYKRRGVQVVNLQMQIPYDRWMDKSEFMFIEKTTGCAAKSKSYQTGASILSFPPPFSPSYEISYLAAPVEPIKLVNETFSANLNFEVAKSTLLYDFKNNGAILDQVNKIIDNINKDDNVAIKSILAIGFASPEGNTAINMRLSQERVTSFISYIKNRHRIDNLSSLFKHEGRGEDWAGLRRVVEASTMADRDAILNIIDNEYDVNKRKNAIKALSRGATYRTLLQDYYPALRRIEYTISYQVRGFNASEAKELIYTKPQQLSLNEMFMVAETYPKTSKEFKEVFDIAARMYPDNPIAQFNTAAMEMEQGSYDRAIARMERMDTAEAYNNLGIAYFYKGEYNKAADAFRKSAAAGLKSGGDNLAQFEQWKADQE